MTRPAILPSNLSPADLGRIAAAKGQSPDACPFKENSDAARQWLEAWSNERRIVMRERT